VNNLKKKNFLSFDQVLKVYEFLENFKKFYILVYSEDILKKGSVNLNCCHGTK